MNSANSTTVRERMRVSAAEVVACCFEHRYLSAQHVAFRFGISLRQAQRLLKQLSAQRLVIDVPIRDVKPDHAKVYVATGKGRRLIAAAYEERTKRPWPFTETQQNRRPARGHGLLHIDHELDVTWLDMAMILHAAERSDLQLRRVERRYQAPPAGEPKLPMKRVPDSGYHVTHQRHGREWFEFLPAEIDRGSMRLASVVDKANDYEQLLTSLEGQAYLDDLYARYGDTASIKPTLRLLLLVRSRPGEGDDAHRLQRLCQALNDSLERDMCYRIWVATWSDLVGEHYDLSAPIWQRASAATKRTTGRLTLFPPA